MGEDAYLSASASSGGRSRVAFPARSREGEGPILAVSCELLRLVPMPSPPTGSSAQPCPGATPRSPTPSASFADLLAEVRSAVDPALASTWAAAIEATKDPSAVAALSAASALSQRGGKRQRAALVALGYLSTSEGEAWQPALPLGIAVEFLQAYLLVHDDWMDQDALRRGGPSVHAALEGQFSDVHRAACGAVLAGDYCAALAQRALASASLPGAVWPHALAAFAQMQLDAVMGQKLDVLSDSAPAEEVYRLKTASYTVLGPLWLGAVSAGAALEQRAVWEQFAVPLGIAFQLRDDMLGAFASQAITGKPRGSDLLAGKRTALVQFAREQANSAQSEAIDAAWGNVAATPSELEAGLEALRASGAARRVEERIGVLRRKAEAALDRLPLARPACRELLQGAVWALACRNQ